MHWIYLHTATRYCWAAPGTERAIKKSVLVCQHLTFWGRTRWCHAADSPRSVSMPSYDHDHAPLSPGDKGYSPSSQAASFLRFSCLSSSQWVCSSWDAVTDWNVTVTILGLTPTGINRAFSDYFFSQAAGRLMFLWWRNLSPWGLFLLLSAKIRFITQCATSPQLHAQRDIWLFVSNLHKPGWLVVFYKSRAPLRTFQAIIYTQIFSTGNLPSTCWGQPKMLLRSMSICATNCYLRPCNQKREPEQEVSRVFLKVLFMRA